VHRYARDKLSAISAVSVRPVRCQESCETPPVKII